MPALVKYSFLALGGRLWFLVIYLLFSLASHLFAPGLPYFWRSAMLGIWYLLSLINYLTIIEVVFGRGITLLGLPYQQIPQNPGNLVASHLVMAFTVASIFITSWVSFYPFAYVLMPGGVTLLAAVNIFSFSLYFTSISLILLMLCLANAATRGTRGATFLGFSAMFLAIYLLVIPVNLNLIGLAGAPIFALTEGTAIAGDILLQTHWHTARWDIILITAVLILQYTSLTYLLSGRVDVS